MSSPPETEKDTFHHDPLSTGTVTAEEAADNILHFIGGLRNDDLRNCDEAICSLEQLVADLLARVQPSPNTGKDSAITLLRVLKSHGWNGRQFKLQEPLNIDALHISLTNYSLASQLRKSPNAQLLSKTSTISLEFNSIISFVPNLLLWHLRKSSQQRNGITGITGITVENCDEIGSSSACHGAVMETYDVDLSMEVGSSTFRGAVMLADISGFSKFSAAKCSMGVVGLNELHIATTNFLGHFINTIYEHQGDVVAFAGDALICVFMESEELQVADSAAESLPTVRLNSAKRATQCALKLVQHHTPELSAHIALAFGDMVLGVLGGLDNQWIYLLNGPCMQTLGECINDAGPKQVAISPSFFLQLRENLSDNEVLLVADYTPNEVERARLVASLCESSGNFIVHCAYFGEENVPVNMLESSTSRAGSLLKHQSIDIPTVGQYFVPRPVLTAVYSGALDRIAELRQVVTMFISLDSYSPNAHQDPLTMQPYFSIVQRSLQKTGGYLRQFIIDDKGCCVIAMWGVPQFSYFDNSLRGLYCAAMIHDGARSIQLKLSVGLTTGYGYCSDIGSQLRRDYVVVSHEVNMAARLMGKAKGRILLDASTRSNLPHEVKGMLIEGEQLVLKGAKEPVVPYTYAGTDILIIDFHQDTKESTGLLKTYLRAELGGILDRISDRFVVGPSVDDRLSMLLSMKRQSSKLASAAMKHAALQDLNSSMSPRTMSASSSTIQTTCMVLLHDHGSGEKAAIQYLKSSARMRSIRFLQVTALSYDNASSYSICRKILMCALQIYNQQQLDGAVDNQGCTSVGLAFVKDLVQRVMSANNSTDPIKSMLAVEKLSRILQVELDADDQNELGHDENSSGRLRRISSPGQTRRNMLIGAQSNDSDIFTQALTLLLRSTGVLIVIIDAHNCDELSWQELHFLLSANSLLASLILTMKTPILVHHSVASPPQKYTSLSHSPLFGRILSPLNSFNQGKPNEEVRDIIEKSPTLTRGHTAPSILRLNNKKGIFAAPDSRSSLAVAFDSSNDEFDPAIQENDQMVLIRTSSGLSSDIEIRGINSVDSGSKESYIIQGAPFHMTIPIKLTLFQSTVIEITPMTEDDIKVAMLKVLPMATIPRKLIKQVLEMTCGSAYWVDSVLQFIVENGIEAFDKTITGVDGNQDSLRRLIVNQLDHLEPSQLILIKQASIIGMEFNLAVLSAIVPKQIKSSLLSNLMALQNMDIINCLADAPVSLYTFQNPLIRQTIYDALSLSDKASAHYEIAQFLQSFYAENLSPHYISLSYHYRQCPGQRKLAVEFSMLSASDAIENGACLTSLACIETANSLVRTAEEIAELTNIVRRAVSDIKLSASNSEASYSSLSSFDCDDLLERLAAVNVQLKKKKTSLAKLRRVASSPIRIPSPLFSRSNSTSLDRHDGREGFFRSSQSTNARAVTQGSDWLRISTDSSSSIASSTTAMGSVELCDPVNNGGSTTSETERAPYGGCGCTIM